MSKPIFRKVMCSEGLPKKNGSYDTSLGTQFFSSVSWWGFPYTPWPENRNTTPEWWLEEVEISTIKAEVWDDGYEIGHKFCGLPSEKPINPYRP